MFNFTKYIILKNIFCNINGYLSEKWQKNDYYYNISYVKSSIVWLMNVSHQLILLSNHLIPVTWKIKEIFELYAIVSSQYLKQDLNLTLT